MAAPEEHRGVDSLDSNAEALDPVATLFQVPVPKKLVELRSLD